MIEAVEFDLRCQSTFLPEMHFSDSTRKVAKTPSRVPWMSRAGKEDTCRYQKLPVAVLFQPLEQLVIAVT